MKRPDYTQGLIVVDGELYESTGIVGQSAIYRLARSGGPRTELFSLEKTLFGEGLAKIGDRFYQLTWRAGLAFAYEMDEDRRHLSRISTFHRDGDGWGLTEAGGELVLSDGSDKLFFIQPETFAINHTVPVRLGSRPVDQLNELEYAHGFVLANIYGDSAIVAIDPADGCVVAVLDARALVAGIAPDLKAVHEPVCPGPCSQWDFVLNGIAYDNERDELFITGKNWPLIFVYRGLLDGWRHSPE